MRVSSAAAAVAVALVTLLLALLYAWLRVLRVADEVQAALHTLQASAGVQQPAFASHAFTPLCSPVASPVASPTAPELESLASACSRFAAGSEHGPTASPARRVCAGAFAALLVAAPVWLLTRSPEGVEPAWLQRLHPKGSTFFRFSALLLCVPCRQPQPALQLGELLRGELAGEAARAAGNDRASGRGRGGLAAGRIGREPVRGVVDIAGRQCVRSATRNVVPHHRLITSTSRAGLVVRRHAPLLRGARGRAVRRVRRHARHRAVDWHCVRRASRRRGRRVCSLLVAC